MAKGVKPVLGHSAQGIRGGRLVAINVMRVIYVGGPSDPSRTDDTRLNHRGELAILVVLVVGLQAVLVDLGVLVALGIFFMSVIEEPSANVVLVTCPAALD